MAISVVDRQLLLVQLIGDIDPFTADPAPPLVAGSNGIVLSNADRLWNLHSDKLNLPILGGPIFDYYFLRDGVALVISILESRVDFSAVGTAMSVRLSQRIAARNMQYQRYNAEILRLEHRLSGMATPLAGLITRVEPIVPPVPGELSSPTAETGNVNVFVIDANDPTLTGSPYWPSWRKR